MKTKVVSYQLLFGDNDFISAWESDTIVKDGVKYLPFDIIKNDSLLYLESWIQEIEI